MAVTQHRPHGAVAGRQFGAFDGKTPGDPPVAEPTRKTQHRSHGAIAGAPYGTLSGKTAAGASAPTAPNTVAGSATGGTTAASTWVDASSNETGFLVELSTNSGGTWATAGTVGIGVQTYAHTGLTPATSYMTGVTALGATTNSARAVSAEWWTDNTGGGSSELPGATTATTARPSADVSAGTWVPSTGVDLYAMIDETAADAADYISTATPGECQMTLSDTAFPGSATQTVSFQAHSTTSATLTVTLKQGATVIATWSQALTPTATIYSRQLSAGEIALIASGPVDVVLAAA